MYVVRSVGDWICNIVCGSSRPFPRSESKGCGVMRDAGSGGGGSEFASSSRCTNESDGKDTSVCRLNSAKGSDEEEENIETSGEVDAAASMVVKSKNRLASTLHAMPM